MMERFLRGGVAALALVFGAGAALGQTKEEYVVELFKI